MNERFKFRVWNQEENEILFYEDIEGSIGFGLSDWLEDPFILMQCTGLKDKNGKLIYEGDILSLYGFNKKQNEEKERSVVKWDYQEASFYFGSVTSYNEDNSSFSNIEIIGNIYENPYLLTEEKAK
jgi:hypothetical protein